MELSMLRKGVFSIAKKPEIKVETEIPPVNDQITFQDYGFLQAGRIGGTSSGLKVSLQKIYFEFKEKVKRDNEKQSELRKPHEQKILQLEGENERLGIRINKIKNDDLPKSNENLTRLKDELSEIKKNPSGVTGDDSGRASFIIGSVILIFLTIYLFVFYSSASYSTFFKQFSLNDIGVASSIFDPQAITKAYNDSITELVLILTIPFVFLGLGYLIHKFQEQKGFMKYVKVAALIIITFIFDTILAYEITEKIYNIKKANDFGTMPDYNFSMAFQSPIFWVIIFAGFIVYLIWGFVFDFIMEAYYKMDKVRIAIEEKELQIKDVEKELKNYDEHIDRMSQTVADNATEIKKETHICNNAIIPREFEQDIYSFLSGWLHWMKQSGMPVSKQDEASVLTDEFINSTLLTYTIN